MMRMLAGHIPRVSSPIYPSIAHLTLSPTLTLTLTLTPQAMVQRLAEKYVGELSEMAKNSNLVTP